MRTFAVGVIAIALLAAACASPVSDDVDSSEEFGSPVSTSPVTTSPVTTSPATTFPATTSPAMTSDAAPSDESVVPSEDEGDDLEPAEQEPTVTTQPPKETPVKPILPVEPVEPHPAGPVAAAIADLASRLGVNETSVTLVSQEEVTWPDGSLGCPQPDMSYIQVLVNGSLVVLEVDGKTYEYHSGVGRDLFYCPNPTAPTSGDYGDV